MSSHLGELTGAIALAVLLLDLLVIILLMLRIDRRIVWIPEQLGKRMEIVARSHGSSARIYANYVLEGAVHIWEVSPEERDRILDKGRETILAVRSRMKGGEANEKQVDPRDRRAPTSDVPPDGLDHHGGFGR